MQGNDHTRIRLDELEETISDEGGSGSSFCRHGRQDRCDKYRRSPAGTGNAVLRRRREWVAKEEWNKRYKLARSYLYGSERIPQDFAEAMRLFSLEADSGNELPCMTKAGCGQTALGWRRIRIRHRNGTGKKKDVPAVPDREDQLKRNCS